MSQPNGFEAEPAAYSAHDPRVVRLAANFELDPELVSIDLRQFARWRRGAGARLMVPWLAERHGWDDDTAHYYLSALERTLGTYS